MNSFIKKLTLYLRLKSRGFGYRFCKIPLPAKWTFIVGCYNSGTTLLHELLAAHPQIGSMPNEGQFFTDQLMTGKKAGVRRLWALKPEMFRMTENAKGIDVNKLKREWAFFYNDAARPILIEKTIANAARTRWLQEHFKPAYFICLFRNGYAVAEGIHRKENHPIDIAAQQWNISNAVLLEDIPHLKNVLQISYEELCDDPGATMQKVTDFLGLSPLPSEVYNSSFTIHKMDSTIKNMNEASIKKLSKEQIKVINQTAGETLKKLNYPLLMP